MLFYYCIKLLACLGPTVTTAGMIYFRVRREDGLENIEEESAEVSQHSVTECEKTTKLLISDKLCSAEFRTRYLTNKCEPRLFL